MIAEETWTLLLIVLHSMIHKHREFFDQHHRLVFHCSIRDCPIQLASVCTFRYIDSIDSCMCQCTDLPHLQQGWSHHKSHRSFDEFESILCASQRCKRFSFFLLFHSIVDANYHSHVSVKFFILLTQWVCSESEKKRRKLHLILIHCWRKKESGWLFKQSINIISNFSMATQNFRIVMNLFQLWKRQAKKCWQCLVNRICEYNHQKCGSLHQKLFQVTTLTIGLKRLLNLNTFESTFNKTE